MEVIDRWSRPTWHGEERLDVVRGPNEASVPAWEGNILEHRRAGDMDRDKSRRFDDYQLGGKHAECDGREHL